MRDMKEAINKAINEYEEHGVSIELTEREKELVEYGYIQCALQIGYDIESRGKSFMMGLQEMVLENADHVARREQMNYRNEFVKLAMENPTLPILPMVECEVCAGDDYGRWGGSIGKSKIVEYYDDNEEMVIKEDYYKELASEVGETTASQRTALIKWIKAIMVDIDIPEE